MFFTHVGDNAREKGTDVPNSKISSEKDFPGRVTSLRWASGHRVTVPSALWSCHWDRWAIAEEHTVQWSTRGSSCINMQCTASDTCGVQHRWSHLSVYFPSTTILLLYLKGGLKMAECFHLESFDSWIFTLLWGKEGRRVLKVHLRNSSYKGWWDQTRSSAPDVCQR